MVQVVKTYSERMTETAELERKACSVADWICRNIVALVDDTDLLGSEDYAALNDLELATRSNRLRKDRP